MNSVLMTMIEEAQNLHIGKTFAGTVVLEMCTVYIPEYASKIHLLTL